MCIRDRYLSDFLTRVESSGLKGCDYFKCFGFSTIVKSCDADCDLPTVLVQERIHGVSYADNGVRSGGLGVLR